MSKRLSGLWMCAVLLAGCSPVVAPTPISTRTPIPTLVPTLAPTQTPTPTLTPTPTPAPTLTPVLTLTSTPTPSYPDFGLAMVADCTWAPGCVYRVSIDADGNVRYLQSGPWGIEQRVGRITPAQIEELVAAINKANIWAMEDDAVITDPAPIAISVRLNGRGKAVELSDNVGDCRVVPPGATPEPGTALCELRDEIARITDLDQWDRPWSTPTGWRTNAPVLSNARVAVTAYIDQNGDGTPEPGEGMNGIPVQLLLPDGKILSATTQRGVATFDMSGYAAGIQITASLPDLYRSYQFFLPEAGTVPIVFSFAMPTVPGNSP